MRMRILAPAVLTVMISHPLVLKKTVKIAVDLRHCEKHTFVRGLVHDGRMVEI